MERHYALLLEAWREACRHIEIEHSAARITAILQRHLPIVALHVLRLDHQAKNVVTVFPLAAGSLATHAAPPQRHACSPGGWRRLLAWARHGELAQTQPDRRSGVWTELPGDPTEGELLAGPLIGHEGPIGAVVLVARSGERFRAQHRDMLAALLEPFSVALENDRRLRELAELREAAEADRRSLLARLGRKEMSDVIVGADSGLRQVMERVELVAGSDVPVLILGETGTGKEVVSRAIHTRSPRSAGPFIRVNCGAIPSELIDSQLFGHERGSFTGAADARQGWFERADGGTLFLDEVGELPLPAQVRLLRVLQDGFVERVGGQEARRVDVRLVAATHRDLASMVKSGSFREDLWYRINVFPILLPRLTERPEDIPPLARHFAERAANRFGLPMVEPTALDLALLVQYRWPGNIRELGAVIDRAAILGNGQRLEIAKALGFNQPPPRPPSPPVTLYEVIPEVDESPLAVAAMPAADPAAVMSLDEAMKQHIQRALVATRARIEGPRGAAAILGINPHTLRARMRKLGIDWSQFRP